MRSVALWKVLKRRVNGRDAVEEREGLCVTVASGCEKGQ